MSDTPRTDKAAFPALYMDGSEIGSEVVTVNCARPMERQLNAALAENERLREALNGLLYYRDDGEGVECARAHDAAEKALMPVCATCGNLGCNVKCATCGNAVCWDCASMGPTSDTGSAAAFCPRHAEEDPIPAARQLLADTTAAVAAMQNEVHAKTL